MLAKFDIALYCWEGKNTEASTGVHPSTLPCALVSPERSHFYFYRVNISVKLCSGGE